MHDSSFLRIRCSNCEARLKVGIQLAGKRISCPKCKTAILVTTKSPAPDNPAVLPAERLPTSPPTAETMRSPVPKRRSPASQSKTPTLGNASSAHLFAGGVAIVLGIVALGVLIINVLDSPRPDFTLRAGKPALFALSGLFWLVVGAAACRRNLWAIYALVGATAFCTLVGAVIAFQIPSAGTGMIVLLGYFATTVSAFDATKKDPAYNGRRLKAIIGAGLITLLFVGQASFNGLVESRVITFSSDDEDERDDKSAALEMKDQLAQGRPHP